jgi:hypothetical protein
LSVACMFAACHCASSCPEAIDLQTEVRVHRPCNITQHGCLA